MKPNPPIPGHKLLLAGDKWPEVGPDEEYTGRMTGGCECGAQPSDWPDTRITATQRWHRQHKTELREAP